MRHFSIGFVLFFLFCFSVTAQDRLAVEQADKERDVNKGLAVTKKFTGRLPNGYKDVVTNSQREEIYKIQKEYFETIELLKIRLEQLESERNLKIVGLLTDEQQAKLKTILKTLESERNTRKATDPPKTSTAPKKATAADPTAPVTKSE